MRRGDIWWADLAGPVGSAPGHRRPVLVIQSDSFNASGISTVITAIMTSNLALKKATGNVLCLKTETGLPRDSVVNVSGLATLDRSQFTEYVGRLPAPLLSAVERGLRDVLAL